MKIVVLAGGTSTERDVSLITGKMVYKALKENGHQVVLVDVYLGKKDICLDGIFDSDTDWSKEIGMISHMAPNLEDIKKLREDPDKGFFGPNVVELCKLADIVFMGLHGSNGEDGRVQAAFDLLGIKYTGSGYFGAAISMDKGLSKQIFVQNNIPTPKGFVFQKKDFVKEPEALMQVGNVQESHFPLVVKTCCGGSSVGVYIASNQEEYLEAIQNAFSYEDEVVVEQYIKGREFSVGVMNQIALPVIEIAPIQGFYDYKNKYQAGSAVETCPADLPSEISKQMQEIAQDVVKALKIDVYARMDFILDEQNNLFCLEANTLPGMTPTSLLPQEAAAIGMGYTQLCEEIIRLSMNK